MKEKILFSVSSLGLGHATRTLSVIKHFINEYDITVISHDNALQFLQKELENENVTFLDFEDYPKLERGEGIQFYWYLFIDLIKTNFVIKNEHKKCLMMEDEYKFIFSDGRYGIYSDKIPSFLLSHQISFLPPKYLGYFKFISDFSNYFYFKNFNTVFIPDYEDKNENLAGNLSHTFMTNFFNHKYIGILSSYKHLNLPEDIDYLFVISGYLQEKKENFISILIEEAKKLEGKKVFMLGDPTKNDIVNMDEYDITIYPSATKELRNELFCRAKTIISRTGYTTIMDLVELGKKAILFPTPNSTEQEYLASYHKYKDYFVICEDENNFDLKELVKKLDNTQIFTPETKTKEALLEIKETINLYFDKHFFSIIVPVYNEEKYIKETIEKLLSLDYDKNRFEIILVENGSTDKSYEIISEYKNDNIKIYQSEKGVSKAKNVGLKHTNESSDWTIFLDADTLIEKDFLKELNNYLNKHSGDNLTIGTTTIKAQNGNLYDKVWFKLFDMGHKITKTSYSVQIAKTSIAKKIRFDEKLNYSEDLKFIEELSVFGNFFFLNTNQVSTSTRRFRKKGYLKTVIDWNIQAFTPYKNKINKEYETVR